jgi:CarboxypepD_reg-like domain
MITKYFTSYFRPHISYLLLSLFLCMMAVFDVHAQGQQNSVLFSGIVTDARSDTPLPNAYIIVKKAGRGALTNNMGYFSMYVFPGDTVTFSYLGYKTQYHAIPKKLDATTYSAIVELREDAKLLQEVKVYPYRTEEEFKDAFLAMQLPNQRERDAIAKLTDPEQMMRLSNAMGMGAAGNYRYFMNQQIMAQSNKTSYTTIPFLNPFAWANFIQSIKRGDLKRKGFGDAANFAPIENLKKSDFIRSSKDE